MKNELVVDALKKVVKMWLPAQAQKMLSNEDYERFMQISETQNIFFFLKKEDIADNTSIKVSADAIFREIDNFITEKFEKSDKKPTFTFQYDFTEKEYKIRVYYYDFYTKSTEIIDLKSKNPLELFDIVKIQYETWNKGIVEKIDLQLTTISTE